MLLYHRLFISLVTWLSMSAVLAIEIDPKGYILYSNALGRLGNEADFFLGALAFAKQFDRTLVLAPWYDNENESSVLIPFDDWFKLEVLQQYHKKVMTMEMFMKELAPHVWPPGQRTGFCLSMHGGKCPLMENETWKKFSIKFDKYETTPGAYDLNHEYYGKKWKEFDNKRYPVLAFNNAPGKLPSLPEHQYLSRYLEFSDPIKSAVDHYVTTELKGKKYLGIHLRNGIDFMKVCDRMPAPQQFSSEQCRNITHQDITYEQCLPPKELVISTVIQVMKKNNLDTLFVATDRSSFIKHFRKKFEKDGLKFTVHTRFTKRDAELAIYDVAILTNADYFIGNCVSSFSALVRRQREAINLPIEFFGVQRNRHDEL